MGGKLKNIVDCDVRKTSVPNGIPQAGPDGGLDGSWGIVKESDLANVKNDLEVLYIKGDSSTDGSIRLSIDSVSDNTQIEKRISGIWQPASFETGPNSLWVGNNIGLAAVGHHLATESTDGHLHFHAHSPFDGGLISEDTIVVDAYGYTERMVLQSDDSGEWAGSIWNSESLSSMDTISPFIYFKTGSTPASDIVRFQVWEGGAEGVGQLIFDESYPASDFPADSEIKLPLNGYLEFTAGMTYFNRISSDSDFSLKTNSAADSIWIASDISLVREDALLQTPQYVEESTYDENQYLIYDRQIYICNVTGAQTGTFASNSDKWDLVGSGDFSRDVSIGGDLTVDTDTLFVDTTSGEVGVGTTNPLGKFHVKTTAKENALVVSDSTGKIGIGTWSPSFNIDIEDTSGAVVQLGLTGENAYAVHRIDGTEFDINYSAYSGEANFKIRAQPSGSSDANYIFGYSNTMTGDQHIILYEPSSTTDIQARISTSGADTFFNAQGGNFGIGTDNPAESAAVDITSTTGALLVPRMTTTERDALTAVNGMTIYNTTTNAFNSYENGSWITVSGGGGSVFSITSNVVSNTEGDIELDDFIFGSPQLADDSDPDHRRRFFFDKSKGAFRAGEGRGTSWDDSARGLLSVGMGYNTRATGAYSVALGYAVEAFGQCSLSVGDMNYAGSENSVCLGNNSEVGATNAITIGTGLLNECYGCFVVGAYNVNYQNPSWSSTDPLFIVGNGADSDNRNNALVLSKNGDLHVSGNISSSSSIMAPQLTTTERNALTAVNGMIIYNATTDVFNFYENGSWVTK